MHFSFHRLRLPLSMAEQCQSWPGSTITLSPESRTQGNKANADEISDPRPTISQANGYQCYFHSCPRVNGHVESGATCTALGWLGSSG